MEERRVNDTSGTRPPDAPMRRTTDGTPGPRTDQPMATRDQSDFALVDRGSVSEFERRWHSIQAEFVEDPRRAVGEAGNLMAELMDHVSKNLRSRRGELDKASGDGDTEVMRQEMRRYKELMNRMLGKDMSSGSTSTMRTTEPTPQTTSPTTTTQQQPRPQNRPSD